MHKIFLINTRHDAIGQCNSNELFQIFEQICPDIIFEEMPPSHYDAYYVHKSSKSLESEAIDKYTQAHKTKHIPIDSENMPSEEFFEDYHYMISRIEGLTDSNGFTFRNKTDLNRDYVAKYGFRYLNSNDCVKINSEINNAIEGGLKKINEEKLSQTFKSWNEAHDMRENHMLKYIYKYSSENNFEKAIFTIGGSHRGSIIKKITEFQKNEKLNLNWQY